MPENLKHDEVSSQTDPSVAKQYDTKTSKVEQTKDYYKLVDSNKVSMLNTYRNGVGQYPLTRLPSSLTSTLHLPV